MIVKKFHFSNWRNLKENTIVPCETVNIFYGDNAQGKTNLLEALWLCSGAKSFRGAKENEMIEFEEQQARLQLTFYSKEREQELHFSLGNKKKVLLNNVEQKKLSDLYETIFMVVFAPNHLNLVKEGPAIRRNFIDFGLERLKPSFISLEEQYNRALDQRNALIREQNFQHFGEDMLKLWEDHLAKLGSMMVYQRQKYIEHLIPFATNFYYELSGKKEQLSLAYDGLEFSSENNGYEQLKQALEESRENDSRVGYTTVGPHRHDLHITINGISARTYGSQGQQRSAALALKMAESEVLSEYVGEKPIILLDDVMSELDSERQDFLLNKFNGRQIFITCCDPASVLRMVEGKTFYIKQGEIYEETNA